MKRIVGLGMVAAAFLVCAAGARAAVTIGQAPPTPAAEQPCASPNEMLQASIAAGGSYAAPVSGVVTSWSTFVGGADVGDTLRLRLYRPGATADTYTPLSESGSATLTGPSSSLGTFGTRQPIAAGDVIGLHLVDGLNGCVYATGQSADQVRQHLPSPNTIGVAGSYTLLSSYRVDVAATIEPDADGDGYGDETQDLCPTDPTRQGPCLPGGGPAPPDTDPPETSITKRPRKKMRKGKKVKIGFASDESGSSFECKLDRGGYKPCTSPRTLKRLKLGKHLFQVKATDAAGNSDPSPARVSFKVKQRKP